MLLQIYVEIVNILVENVKDLLIVVQIAQIVLYLPKIIHVLDLIHVLLENIILIIVVLFVQTNVQLV